MKVIDLTQTIEERMPVYPGTEGPRLEPASTYERDGFRETLLTLYSHTGTHMDAPAHLFPDRTTLDGFPASQFLGKGLVVDCREFQPGEEISMSKIQAVRDLADQAEFLLFLTGWGRFWGKEEYFGEYPVISREICEYVLQSGKKGVGFDTIGIDPVADSGLTRHRLLFAQEVVVIENLKNLELVGSELFWFAALPMKYQDADGAPVRAVALTEEV